MFLNVWMNDWDADFWNNEFSLNGSIFDVNVGIKWLVIIYDFSTFNNEFITLWRKKDIQYDFSAACYFKSCKCCNFKVIIQLQINILLLFKSLHNAHILTLTQVWHHWHQEFEIFSVKITKRSLYLTKMLWISLKLCWPSSRKLWM